MSEFIFDLKIICIYQYLIIYFDVHLLNFCKAFPKNKLFNSYLFTSLIYIIHFLISYEKNNIS